MNGSRHDEAGFGVIGLLSSLAVLCILAVFAVKSVDALPAAVGSGTEQPSSTAKVAASNSTASVGIVAQTADLVAQQNLALGLSFVDLAATNVGGYGDISAAVLSAEGRGLHFTSGASTSSGLVSVAAAGASNGGVTLAVRSASGTCWFIWTSNAATWSGSENSNTSCTAPRLSTAPGAQTIGNRLIVWHPGTFSAA